MRTIPNLTPVANPYVIFNSEVMSSVEEDSFVWLEMKQGDADCRRMDYDDVFYLRILYKNDNSLDFATPFGILHLEMEDYCKTWKLWYLSPYPSQIGEWAE